MHIQFGYAAHCHSERAIRDAGVVRCDDRLTADHRAQVRGQDVPLIRLALDRGSRLRVDVNHIIASLRRRPAYIDGEHRPDGGSADRSEEQQQSEQESEGAIPPLRHGE